MILDTKSTQNKYELQTPGAVPPYLYNSDKSADKSVETSGISPYHRPQTGRSHTCQNRAGQSLNNNGRNQNGEDSQTTIVSSSIATPQQRSDQSALFAFKYSDRNLMDYQTFVHMNSTGKSTRKYSSTAVTDVYDTDFMTELNVLRSQNQNEEKCPNMSSFNHKMNDIISVISASDARDQCECGVRDCDYSE